MKQAADAIEPDGVVAPLAGAWIETKLDQFYKKVILVAPLAGAWIETLETIYIVPFCLGSPPSRGRGLKHILEV